MKFGTDRFFLSIKDIVSDKVICDKVIYDIVPVQAENWTKCFLTHKKTRTRGDVQMMFAICMSFF